MHSLVRAGFDEEAEEPLYGIMKNGRVEPYQASKWLDVAVDPGEEITEFRRQGEELNEEMKRAIADYRQDNEALAFFGMNIMDIMLEQGDEKVVEQYRDELEEFAQSSHYSAGTRAYATTILGALE